MEQCYRIALWMFLLIGYLQASPVPSRNMGQCEKPVNQRWPFIWEEQPFEDLRGEVKCEKNVTFISPPQVKDHCQEALNCFTKGLLYAKKECKGVDRIYQAVDYLTLPSKNSISAECERWENKGSRKNFEDFMKDLEAFATWVNSIYTAN